MATTLEKTSVQDMKASANHEEYTSKETASEDAIPSEPIFDPVAEARLRWKIDICIVPIVSIIYLFCFIDRANIGNARLAGFETDLRLTGYDYNTIVSIFYVSYIIFEIPSNLACKWVGPGWFLPILCVGFGICTVAFAFVRSLKVACGVRFLLGVFEAGLLPGIAYYLSRWYRRSELAFRLSMYIVMSSLAGAFGGLLASGILKLDNVGSTTRWQMIFLVEGVITIGIGVLSLFILTDRPETARWLTREEKELACRRVQSERVGTQVVLDGFSTKKILAGLLNPITVGTGVVFLLGNVTVQGLALFAPTIVRTIYPNNSVISNQLYTVPPYVVGGFFILLVNYISWKVDRRNLLLIISAPAIMVGYIIFLATTEPTPRYVATFIIAAGAFNSGALSNAQVSANVVSDTARSSAIGFVVMLGNIGGLIASWSFLPKDHPNYHIGNGLNLATSTIMLVIATVMEIWMRYNNGQRARRDAAAELEGLDASQIEDLDWKHPAFRWKP